MRMTSPFFAEPTDFSLVQGGPLFQLLLRARLLRPPIDLLARRIVVILIIAWMPLFVLSLLSGRLYGGTTVPFLFDLGAQARFLLCVPILIAAEVIVHGRIKGIVRQFLERRIVAPADELRFEECIASAMRLRNSVLAEALLLAISIAAGYWVGRRYVDLDLATWYATPAADGKTHLTMAGYWYFFVSLVIFRFLLLRWYFRLFVWYRFLWQVSRRVPLQLNPLHPDRSGGLAFLSNSAFAFQPILLAHTIGLAGIIGGKIWHDGARLIQFKLEIVAWMLYLMLLVGFPLFFFMRHLATAKRAGLREYGIVASSYVDEFRRKWIAGNAAKDEQLIGTADIQSLADLSNSFEVVREMRLVPFGRSSVIRLAVMTVLPLAPLVLTMISLDQLIDRMMGVFL